MNKLQKRKVFIILPLGLFLSFITICGIIVFIIHVAGDFLAKIETTKIQQWISHPVYHVNRKIHTFYWKSSLLETPSLHSVSTSSWSLSLLRSTHVQPQ